MQVRNFAPIKKNEEDSGNTSKKDVNQNSHIAFSPISQSFFFKGVRCLILASSQRKLSGYIEFLKLDVTIKKNQIRLKFKGLHRFL